MPDSTTLNHAARILAASADAPADAVLRDYLADRPRLPQPERRAVSQAVFAYFRWRQWLEPGVPLPEQLSAASDLQAKFAADPRSVKPAALAARAVPAWLAAEMELPVEFLQHLQREPALWLRARPGTGARLAAALGHCTPAPQAAEALRYTGSQDLFRSRAFQAGEFEIQDLASQRVGLAAAPQPGETWWDVCAGEGGKTLHLADLMANRGLIWATDRSLRRLDVLKRRAARAKIFNYRAAAWRGIVAGVRPALPTKGKFDGVLVDAPCSAVGTWQRNPHARWTTTPRDIAELAATQAALLDAVAGSVKIGGRLIYAVCTLTRRETEEVAAGFLATHPDFTPEPLVGIMPAGSSAPAPSSMQLWPQAIQANGMFIAAWRRQGATAG
jgi:16S rRNA (cytosine967-C5)-methyltransferase